MSTRRRLLQSAASLPALASLPFMAPPAGAQSNRASTLKLVPQAGLTVLDPIFTTAAGTQAHGYCIFDTLFGLNANFEPQPQMVDTWRVSDDQLTWTFQLRTGLKFHDGNPVQAADCIASLKRWGARDALGQLLVAAVKDWTVVNPGSFALVLKAPFPLMLYALGKPATSVPFIMPERIASSDPNKQVTEMVGSGPYRFVAAEFVAGAKAVYTRFADYVPRKEPAERTSGGKVAYFERVEWIAMPDPATALAALQSGEIDWWEQALADTVPLLRKNSKVTVTRGDPTGYVGLIRFNSAQAPFNNVKLRRAVLMAVNQRDYMDAITNSDTSSYQTCESFLPCGTPYGRPTQPNFFTPSGDLAKARALVKESGYKGEKIVIINPSDFATIRPMGQITFEVLKQLGLNVELAETDWGTVLQRRSSREPVEKGGWSIFHTWWQAIGITTPATSGYVRAQGDKGWFGWYGNDRIEQLVTEWLAASAEPERVRIADAIQSVVAEEVPAVPLGVFTIPSAHRAELTGIVPGVAPFPWGVKRG